MTQEQVLVGLKKDVRSLLVSAKHGLAPEQLKRDYINMLGHPLPLRPLGFRNVMDMVKEMPDVVAVDYTTDGSVLLTVVSDKSTRGIEELVAKQRNQKSKPTVWRPVLGSQFPRYHQHTPQVFPRRVHAPPSLPAQLSSQLRQLLSQGPIRLSELEPCFARRFGRPLQVTHYGFYSIAEMLAAASDLVAIKQSRTGSLLMLKNNMRSPTQTLSSTVSPQQVTFKTKTSPLDPEEESMLTCCTRKSPVGTLGEGKQHNGASKLTPKPIQEEDAFEKCVKKLEEQLRNKILESGAAGTVSQELKEQLCQVVAQNSEGISIHDLPGEFKRVTGEDLPVVQCGFLSVTEMVSALSDILYLQPGPEKGANSWIIRNNQQMETQQGGILDNSLSAIDTSESMNPSNRWYYSNSEESPWEGRGEREEPVDALEEDNDLQITTKTFSQMVDTFPAVALQMSGGTAVPPDALQGRRLKAPTRREERELEPVLVERVESPSHFYIRFHETQEARALENMMIEMRTCYTCPKVAERYQLLESYIQPGQVCCLGPRGMWFYRVIIHRVLNDSQVEVYYVDFGDLNTADRSSLKFLKSCYSELPAQAVPSLLTAVRPVSGTWSKSAVKYFQKLCCERTLVAAIHSYQEDILHLFLCDTHTEEDIYIHTALQMEGHALSCTSLCSSVIFGQFNPVTLYMRTGSHEDGMLADPSSVCSLDCDQQSPDQRIWGKPPTQTGPIPDGGAKLRLIRKEEDLSDLPELEFINIPEDNTPVQQAEKANPFGALLCKDPVYISGWDQGWTPGIASEDMHSPEHAAKLSPVPKSSEGEEPPQAVSVTEPPQPVPAPVLASTQPPTTPQMLGLLSCAPSQTQGWSGGVSSLGLQQHLAFSFMFPSLRYPSPTVLGPAARLAAGTHLRWYPHKME